MGYIITDTEGTGLFETRYPENHPDPEKAGKTKPSDDPGQPRMAEFAAVLCDDDFNIESTYQSYIQPVGWQNSDRTPLLEMPEIPLRVHGLSMDFLREHGKPVELALNVFTSAIKEGRILVGFNQQHDGRQVRAEIRHAGRRALGLSYDMPDKEVKAALKAGGHDDLFEETPNICAMRSLSSGAAKIALGKIPKLNGKGGFLGLVDAAAFFDIPFASDRRHTALEDATVTAKVAQQLHIRGLLLPAEVHYAKDSPNRKVTPGRE